MKMSVDNMNSLPTAKYKQVPDNIRIKTLKSEAKREIVENLPEKKIKVKISARSGRRSTHTHCPAQEKILTWRIL